MSETSTRSPRFNHVAMSMSADALDEHSRADILRFYGEVFGWNELPMLTEDRHRLVMQVYDYEQFVFLISEDEPMTCRAWTTSGCRWGRSRSCSTSRRR